MPNVSNEKSVTLVIYRMTFVELQIRSEELNITMGELYLMAIETYLSYCNPDRRKVLAAPGSGKTVRVNMSKSLYFKLSKKIGNKGANINDVVYTALECFLDKGLKSFAA